MPVIQYAEFLIDEDRANRSFNGPCAPSGGNQEQSASQL